MELEKNTENENEVKKVLSKVARTNFPADNPEDYKTIFNGICNTYDLQNPVDQMIANRATTQLLMLQYIQSQLKKFGLFFERKDSEGQKTIVMNPLSYYLKQLESEFRANIRMLRGNQVVGSNKPQENFSEWLTAGSKKKKVKVKK